MFEHGINEMVAQGQMRSVEFTDQSESFASGFQMGQIWDAMSHRDPVVGRTIHKDNMPMVLKMAEQHRYMLVDSYAVGSAAVGGSLDSHMQIELIPFPSKPELKVLQ